MLDGRNKIQNDIDKLTTGKTRSNLLGTNTRYCTNGGSGRGIVG